MNAPATMATKNGKLNQKATKAKRRAVAKSPESAHDTELALAHSRMVDLAESLGIVEMASRNATEASNGALCNCADDLTNDMIEAAYEWALLRRK